MGYSHTQSLGRPKLQQGRVVVFLFFLNSAQPRIWFRIRRIELRRHPIFSLGGLCFVGPKKRIAQAHVARFEVGKQSLELLQLGDRLPRLASHESRRKVLPYCGIVRIEPLGLAKLDDRRRHIPLFPVGDGQIIVRVREIRLQRDGLLIFGDGVVVDAPVMKQQTQVIVHDRVVGFDAQRFLIFRHGSVKLLRLVQRQSCIFMGLGVFGILGQRRFGFIQRILKIS